MSGNIGWSHAEIETAKQVLPRHAELGSACAELTKRFGRRITEASLRSKFEREGLESPMRMLSLAGAPPPAPPIAHKQSAPSAPSAGVEDLGRLLGRTAISEACDALDVSPKRLREIVDEAARAGQRVRIDGDELEVLAPEPAKPQVEVPRDPATMLEERSSSLREKRLRAERDSLLEQLHEANERASFYDAVRAPTVPVIERRERTSGLREGTLVAMASDWHVEENVDPASIAGVNEYNLTIAEARAWRFFDGIKWLLNFERQAFQVRDVVLWLGGDLYTGYLHPENVETAELAPVESIVFLKGLLTHGIRHLLADPLIERLVIPCSYGNHGRTTEKKRIATGAQNSFEWMLYQILKGDFAHEKRVSFTCDQSAHQYVEAYDQTLHFTHGDELRYGGGIGGLAIPLGRRVPKWDRVKPAHLHHLGHWHTFADIGPAHTIVNGSLIGYNSYSQSIGADFEPPQQASYVFDSRRGKALVTPIWVGEHEHEREVAA